MGIKCCGLYNPHHDMDQVKNQLRQLNLNEKQIMMLHLIYNDLAERDIEKAITLQNFLLFFHKNGFWGQRLFKYFDYNQQNRIVQKQFIIGIAKIFKSNEVKKIQLLYNEFSHNGKKSNGYQNQKSQPNTETSEDGITFKNFLVMLYNYPKADLKNILDDKEFFETQLRGSLKTIGQNRRLQSVYKMGTYLKDLKPVECKFEDKAESQLKRMESSKSISQYQSSFGSMIGKNVLKNLKRDSVDQTTLHFQDGERIIEIKTNNFHHLVKKFAQRMFKDFNLDIKTQKMTKEQFQKWILKHKKLYDTYYSGFHNQVWQVDETTQELIYLTCACEMKSPCKFLHINCHEQKVHHVKALLIHSIIIITDRNDLNNPHQVICLEGLAVNKVNDKQQGKGISITHRDGVYRKRQLFFEDEQTRDQWFQALKLFKGQNIETLYFMGKKIGTGRFSVVYEGTQKKTAHKYAIKVIESYKLQEQERQLISHETRIMQVFSHPLLVRYKESIQTKTHLYIVTQLCKGKDLFEFVKDYTYLGEYDAAIIMQQMIVGIIYMHSLGIVHRDLKPENIIVDTQNGEISQIKIIDFGFANYLEFLQQQPPQCIVFFIIENLAGTPNYIAPQILRRGTITYKIDIFALGSILYYILSGALPFNDYSLTQIFNKTLDGNYQFKGKRFESVSEQAKNLIDMFLENDPDKRITLQQALKHPWFKLAKSKKQCSIKHRDIESLKVF